MELVPTIRVTIVCTDESCQRYGIEWVVVLRPVVPGVVELPEWRCVFCGSKISLAAPIQWAWGG
jgi:hypothetical protein